MPDREASRRGRWAAFRARNSEGLQCERDVCGALSACRWPPRSRAARFRRTRRSPGSPRFGRSPPRTPTCCRRPPCCSTPVRASRALAPASSRRLPTRPPSRRPARAVLAVPVAERNSAACMAWRPHRRSASSAPTACRSAGTSRPAAASIPSRSWPPAATTFRRGRSIASRSPTSRAARVSNSIRRSRSRPSRRGRRPTSPTTRCPSSSRRRISTR